MAESVCRVVWCCKSPDKVHELPDGKILVQCCEDDFDCNGATDISELSDKLCCRDRWCCRVTNWGNDGGEPTGTCYAPQFLGEAIDDYTFTIGCGSGGPDPENFWPCGNGGIGPTGDPDFEWFSWESNPDKITFPEATVDITIQDNNFAIGGGFFDGALIVVELTASHAKMFNAKRMLPFPFSVGELYGPHCDMTLTAGGTGTPPEVCTHDSIISIW